MYKTSDEDYLNIGRPAFRKSLLIFSDSREQNRDTQGNKNKWNILVKAIAPFSIKN